MRNVCEAWNTIYTEICHANTPLSLKMAPNYAILEFKMNSCLAIMVKIRHGHGFGLLENCFKVQINSLARFIEHEKGIPHVIVIL